MTGEQDAVSRAWREHWGRLLALLVSRYRRLDLAEDGLADAFERAAARWPIEGAPDNPAAWLLTTARRRVLDRLRAEAVAARAEPLLATDAALAEAAGGPRADPGDLVADERLRLVLLCCHPALSVESSSALALRLVIGLPVPDIARLFLSRDSAVAARITRAKRKIAVAGIPYRTPGQSELPGRLRGVLAAVYLLFNEGYSASVGEDLIRSSLGGEALRLCRLLHELLPAEPAVRGLLALVLLQGSRHAARLDEDGGVVVLADQDRSRWDRAAIEEGMTHLGIALRATPVRPDLYVTQAAVAACHALAGTWESTNWRAIVSWYDVLLTITDTPVVRLNRAVAVAELDGPAAGLAELDAIGPMPGYGDLLAARADLLARLGRCNEAAEAYREALALPGNGARRRHLEQRLHACAPAD